MDELERKQIAIEVLLELENGVWTWIPEDGSYVLRLTGTRFGAKFDHAKFTSAPSATDAKRILVETHYLHALISAACTTRYGGEDFGFKRIANVELLAEHLKRPYGSTG